MNSGKSNNDSPQSEQEAHPLDLPPFLWAAIALGNLLLFLGGRELYAAFHFQNPTTMELLSLAIIDIALILFRWKLPKLWEKLTGEHTNSSR